ncbi:MAG: UDP-N-acetylglucosamine 2-epimerase (hydrolyzing) [Alphaproteobacteria bacterium]|nr:UDP-N-acetylglucosamine 2-epimerase (hydrolyzing) [Alphaproteobacteria bacterium]
MKRKICVVITARPSYARIRTALEAIRNHPSLELQLVIAASALLDRYGNAISVIEKEGFKIDRHVYMILEGENLITSAKSTGFGMAELATAFDDLKPDVVISIADRFETMATAVAAAYMNIPLAHVQGGEVTGSIDEKVRHAITKLADIHFVASSHAAERVIKMGENPDQVYITGCPSIDIAKKASLDPIFFNKSIFDVYNGVGPTLDLTHGYLVVMQHPVTTEYSDARRHIEETLYAISEMKIPTLWFWPNVDAGSDGTSKGIRNFRERNLLTNAHFFKNIPPEHFIQLLMKSKCIIGNSSVAIRECSYLGVPAVNIGTRQAGRDRGKNVIDVDYNRTEIMSAIKKHLQNGFTKSDTMYGDGKAGERIADYLAKIPLTIEKRLTY